jgi:hypothetical protein
MRAFGNRSAPSRWSQWTCETITSVIESGARPNRRTASDGFTNPAGFHSSTNFER